MVKELLMRVGNIAFVCTLSVALGCAAGAFGQSGASGVQPVPEGVAAVPGQAFGYWPSVSPFDSAYTQHYLEHGLWVRRTAGAQRSFFVSLDYLTGRSKGPTGILGEPNAMSYIDTIDLANLTNAQNAQNLYDTVKLYEDLGRHGLFTRLDLEQVGRVHLWGLRFRWGYDNPDDTGFVLTAWFSRQTEKEFYNAKDNVAPSRGTQQRLLEQIIRTPVDELDPTTFIPRNVEDLAPLYRPLDVDQLLQNNLLNLNGLPLDDGTLRQLPDGTFVGGVTVPFDLEFKVDYQVETWGGSLNWMARPLLRFKAFRLRPLFGVRFLQLREKMRFIGRDSGLVYGYDEGTTDAISADVKIHSLPNHFDDDGDGIVDNAGVVEDTLVGGGGGGGGTATDFLQFRDPQMTPFPITAFLENDIRSYMAGPEIGLQYDIGGERFKISGHTKFALVANHERIWLDGDNIAMITRDSDLLPQTPEDAQPNRFSEKQRHTHVSPLFEQSIVAEGPLFAVPVIRRVPVLRDANFRVGYTFILIGLVARPSESIVWQGNPVEDMYPRIKVDRSSWWASYWTFGLDWRY